MSDETKPLDVRQTDVTVGIRRIYNVGSYESLQIRVETTDKITWKTVSERENKTENLAKILVNKFEKSSKAIFEGLGEVEKHAQLKQNFKKAKEEG